MAKNKFYEPIDEVIVTRLGIKAQSCGFVYIASGEVDTGEVYLTNEDTYNKVKSIFAGRPNVEIKKGDKVFLLPNYPLTHERVKEHLKKIGASLTTDIEKATVIGGGSLCHESIDYVYGSQPNMTGTLMFRYTMNHHMANVNDKLHIITGYAYASGNHGLNEVFRSESSEFYLTPYSLKILYKLLSSKLPVGNLDCLATSANSTVVLDAESAETISDLLASKNSADVQTGISILIHCDYFSDDSEYYLWKLAVAHGRKIYSVRKNKSIEYFITSSKWFTLNSMTHESFLKYREEKGKLSPTIINELMPLVFNSNLKETSDQLNNEYFDVVRGENEFTFRLKDKWVKLLKPQNNECSNQ